MPLWNAGSGFATNTASSSLEVLDCGNFDAEFWLICLSAFSEAYYCYCSSCFFDLRQEWLPNFEPAGDTLLKELLKARPSIFMCV